MTFRSVIKMMKYVLLFILAIFTTSCRSQIANAEFETLSLQKTPCRGFCPVYKLTLKKDGTATLNGERYYFEKMDNPQAAGIYHSQISKEKAHLINTLVKNFKETPTEEKYKDARTDMSSYYLNVTFTDGTTKKVNVYGKTEVKAIHNLYKELDQLRNSENWKK